MSAITTQDRTEPFRATPSSSHALCVMPRGRGEGFRASIRGHILDLADPSSGHALAPIPDDLFIQISFEGMNR